MRKISQNIVFYTLVPITLAINTLLCLPIALLPEKYRYQSRLFHLIVNLCAKLILLFSFIKYKIYGIENLSVLKKPSIFVVNHSSCLDIPVLEILLKYQPRIWITKTEYTKIPIWGFVLDRMHVAVQRGSHSSAKTTLSKTIRIANQYNCHVIIFPEGRRYTDGKIHTFYSGFAAMAQALDRPVIPVAISGLNKVLPAKSFFIDSDNQMVKISIGQSISHRDFQTRQDFVDYTQRWFEKELKKLNTK